MFILHLSDTHSKHHELRNLPPADIIIHSGDITFAGSENEVMDFIQWFGALFQAHLKPSQCDEFFKDIEQLINYSTYSKPNDKCILTRSYSIDRNGNYSFHFIREQPEESMGITISPKTYDMSVSFGTW